MTKNQEEEKQRIYQKYWSRLITFEQFLQLLEQGENLFKNPKIQPEMSPVVKIIVKDPRYWLLSSIEPKRPTVAQGICHAGFGSMGFVYLNVQYALLDSTLRWLGRDESFLAEENMGDSYHGSSRSHET